MTSSKLANPFGRSTPEWIGKTPDAPIPDHVKLRVWERCGGRCALTGKKLFPGDPVDFDHIKPLADGGEHRERNLQIVWRPAHRQKTAEEAGPRAKATRNASKHHGLKTKSKRGFRKHPTLKRKVDGRVVPRFSKTDASDDSAEVL